MKLMAGPAKTIAARFQRDLDWKVWLRSSAGRLSQSELLVPEGSMSPANWT